MQSDIITIFIVLVVTWGLWALNERMNNVPSLKPIVSILIIVAGCLFIIAPVVHVFNHALNSAKSA